MGWAMKRQLHTVIPFFHSNYLAGIICLSPSQSCWNDAYTCCKSLRGFSVRALSIFARLSQPILMRSRHRNLQKLAQSRFYFVDVERISLCLT